MRRVKWGVLGLARIAEEKVIPALQASEYGEVVAIASRDLDRAQSAAAALGAAKAYGSYEELIDDPEIEAIYNPQPNVLETPWTERALLSGKHVLCEKPFALNHEEAERLIAARDKSGRLVAEAFMLRFHPHWRRARDLARSGEIGEPKAIQAMFAYRLLEGEDERNPSPGGGELYAMGCYAILTARRVFGAEPVRVAAAFGMDSASGPAHIANVVIEFPGPRHLTFSASTQLSPFQHIAIAGALGRFEVQIPVNAPADKATRLVIDSAKEGGGARVEEMKTGDPYAWQGDAFSRAVLGIEPLEFSVEDTLANMRVIEACFVSARKGGWVSVSGA